MPSERLEALDPAARPAAFRGHTRIDDLDDRRGHPTPAFGPFALDALAIGRAHLARAPTVAPTVIDRRRHLFSGTFVPPVEDYGVNNPPRPCHGTVTVYAVDCVWTQP